MNAGNVNEKFSFMNDRDCQNIVMSIRDYNDNRYGGDCDNLSLRK